MKRLIIYIFLGFCLVGCNHKTSINDELPVEENSSALFIGLWYSVDRCYPYEAGIRINPDSTFLFEYRACLFYGFSTGTWFMDGDTIVLNSTLIDSCMYMSHFGIDCIEEELNDSIAMNIKTTNKDCQTDETDQYRQYVLFDNERFYLVNDTLTHIFGAEKLCPDIRNDFYRVIRESSEEN